MRALLDINVIIGLLDADHDFHHRAHAWWRGHENAGWASCPLTQNGVVRIMSNPAYNPRRSLAPEAVTRLLRTFTGRTNHEFWPDSMSILDTAVFDAQQILGPRQVTDLYLLALAASQGGRLVTFDESVNRKAVRKAGKRSLEVI